MYVNLINKLIIGKAQAEEKMKKINYAYSILSDSEKRKQYDESLRQERLKAKQEEEKIIANNIQNNYIRQQEENINNINNQSTNNPTNKKVYTQKDYVKDYNKRLRKYKRQLIGKNFIDNIKAIAILCIIITFLWFFPPSHKLIINLYEENVILQVLVNLVMNF